MFLRIPLRSGDIQENAIPDAYQVNTRNGCIFFSRFCSKHSTFHPQIVCPPFEAVAPFLAPEVRAMESLLFSRNVTASFKRLSAILALFPAGDMAVFLARS